MPLPSPTIDGGWDDATFETDVLAGAWIGGQQQFAGARRVVDGSPFGSLKACRFEVDGRSSDGYGNRAEVQMPAYEAEGDDLVYTWTTRFGEADGSGFPDVGNGWALFRQWHSTADGSPPVAFYANGHREMSLDLNLATGSSNPRAIVEYGHRVWSAPLVPGKRYDFELRVGWSSSDTRGFVELKVNGLPQTLRGGGVRYYRRTLDPGRPVFGKIGLYRQNAVGTQVVYHDNVTIRPAATVPPPPPPPPPPPDCAVFIAERDAARAVALELKARIDAARAALGA